MILLYYLFLLICSALSVFFFALYIRSKQTQQALTAFLLVVPVVYEGWVLQNCTGECNIRVDLILLFPVELLVLSALSIHSWRQYKEKSLH
ncbi:MAG: hypothetical protein B6D77_01615 [gamma proteobacterium symbiont of Ctena orbiculata]|nr:MAG: hypothetical protein B6D77_01615 [gamma proteobacterium symbiont of Ctena orbiculata]PVV18778.1 MAG: hypothetical protein B6D78_15245 [gamma proteobacterium symbiont of Ctena orbiculata]PVV26972.1 MAG: hypothetical protein B6D79_04590 [gamma proteobacterium symbiont of Ctena orbiculata]